MPANLPGIPELIWGLFLLMLLYALIHAAVFVYHWHNYNIASKKFLSTTYIVYFSGLAFFLFGFLISTIALTASL